MLKMKPGSAKTENEPVGNIGLKNPLEYTSKHACIQGSFIVLYSQQNA